MLKQDYCKGLPFFFLTIFNDYQKFFFSVIDKESNS